MVNFEHLLGVMLAEAPRAFGDAWDDVKAFVPTELRKLALQVVDIGENVAKFERDPTQGFPAATAKVLFQMQRRAFENVLMAATALTLIATERAINRILEAARSVASETLDAIL